MGVDRHGPLRGTAAPGSGGSRSHGANPRGRRRLGLERSALLFALTLALALAALGGVAGADHDLFQLVSAGEINGNGAFDTDFAGVSADGTRVFFITNEKLVSADTDASTDIYERSGGTTKRVSAGQINGNGAFNAFFEGASADGSRIFFITAEPLVAADTDASVDVYERSGGTTKLVSAGQINGNGAFGVAFEGASPDGTRVFFRTDEKLVAGDTDGQFDVYERSGGSTKRVSAGQINGNGAFDAAFEGASADGTRVFFVTNEKLVSADTDASQEVYERSAGTTTKISSGNGAFATFFDGASAGGTRVFFQTQEQLVSGDTDASTDLYQRSAGGTNRVSAGQINGKGAFDATFEGASTDGARVFFDTSEKLVSTDTDASTDIYERSSGTTKRVSAGAINGNGAFSAVFAGVSVDGTRVFFETNEKLVSADTDASQDVYERSGGTTSRVSAGNGAFNAGSRGASPDGSALFFATEEKVIADDEDSSVDIYGAYVAP
jgi:Tol biopolymer transport system component